MIYILSTVFFICCFLHSKSQNTISPLDTNEYCPNTEYTFTATILKAFSSIIGTNGAIVTQAPVPPVGSTFTFKGKFGDVNQKQIFKVTFTDNTFTNLPLKRSNHYFFQVPVLQYSQRLLSLQPRVARFQVFH